MQGIDNKTIEPEKILPIIFVIDTSGSMAGRRIESLNDAMIELINKVEIADSQKVNIKVGALQFSTGAEWVTNGLVDSEDFYWNDLAAGGLTDLGAALKELNKVLTSNSLFVDGYQHHTSFPIIVFISDGYPADDWENPLSELMDNYWFRYGCKLAFVIGDDVDVQCFTKLTGCEKMVFPWDIEERPELLIVEYMRAFWQIDGCVEIKVKEDEDSNGWGNYDLWSGWSDNDSVW